MSRKDYELIAAAFRAARLQALTERHAAGKVSKAQRHVYDVAQWTLQDMARRMATALQDTNPLFDFNRFVQATYPTPAEVAALGGEAVQS